MSTTMSGTMSGPDEQREHEATELPDGVETPGCDSDPFAPDDMGNFPDFPATSRFSTFSICDDSTAGWYLNKLAALDEEEARIKANAAAIVARVVADRARLKSRFDAELEVWAKGKLDGGKTKTLRLLQGSVAFRTVPAALHLSDKEAAFVEARTVCPNAIETVETLNKAAFTEWAKARFEKTGELPAGMERTPAHESMSVRLGGAK